jgi:hypothetical protein
VLTDFVVTACNVDVTFAKPLKTHNHIFDGANKVASGRNGKAFIFGLPAHRPQNPLAPVFFKHYQSRDRVNGRSATEEAEADQATFIKLIT